MRSTRDSLTAVAANLDESMGVRDHEGQLKLSPIPSKRDAGRKPLRKVGTVEIARVVPDPDQPREQFSEEAIDRLARSISEKGQLSAIRVRWSEELAKWVIIAGERRWRAAKRAGLATIDCYFHEGPLTASEILQHQLIENCLREDLQPIEEARAFAKLIAMNRWTRAQLAEALRIAPSKVSRALALLKLPADVQDQVTAGAISARSAYELSKLKGDRARRKLAQHACDRRLTHKQTAKAVRQRKGRPAPKSRATKQTFSTDQGWRVVVSAGTRGTYHDIEQALLWALDEVRHRIANGVRLF